MFGFLFSRRARSPSIEELEIQLDIQKRQAVASLTKFKETIAAFTEDGRAQIREAATSTPLIGEMIRSKDITLSSLRDDKAETRIWALIVLDYYHDDIDHVVIKPILEDLAFRDSNWEVRTRAIRFLGAFAGRTESKQRFQMGKRLSAVVLDEAEPLEIRKAAYSALCTLDSRGLAHYEKLVTSVFPEGIDWEYVRAWK